MFLKNTCQLIESPTRSPPGLTVGCQPVFCQLQWKEREAISGRLSMSGEGGGSQTVIQTAQYWQLSAEQVSFLLLLQLLCTRAKASHGATCEAFAPCVQELHCSPTHRRRRWLDDRMEINGVIMKQWRPEKKYYHFASGEDASGSMLRHTGRFVRSPQLRGDVDKRLIVGRGRGGEPNHTAARLWRLVPLTCSKIRSLLLKVVVV